MAVWRAELRPTIGKARQQNIRNSGKSAITVQQHHRDPQRFPRKNLQRQGNRGPLRRAHRWASSLPCIYQSPLSQTRPHTGQNIRQQSQKDMPHFGFQQHHRLRHPVPELVRQQVLRWLDEPTGVADVGPGSLHGQENEEHRHELCCGPVALLSRVCQFDDKDVAVECAHGEARRD